MASPKTRANLARVAAAAVFAAGASLAVVGTAAAQNGEDEAGTQQEDSSEGTAAGAVAGNEGAAVGVVAGSSGETTDGSTTDGSTTDGSTTDGSTTDGSTTDGSTTDGSTSEGSTSEGSTSEGSGTNGNTSNGSGGSPEGVSEGSSGNDVEPDTQGGNEVIEQDDPDEDLTETTTGDTTQNGDGDELAETGSSANETLLIIGAATMIAGGVAFRYLPRVITKGSSTA